MLKQRKLGQQGLTVSELGLGCMGMTSPSYGISNDNDSINTIHHAIDLGVTFFDTAEIYGPYSNEKLLGRALKGYRDKVIIATKFGYQIENNKKIGLNSRPDHIKKAVEGSLQRLGMSHIDLLYQHRVDPTVPIEDVVGAMADLIHEGKILYLGLSEVGINTIRRAHAVHPISVLQSEYSLWERNLETDIIPLLRQLNVGLVPFAPLGRGFLTGHVKRAEAYPENDFRRNDPRFQGENYNLNMHTTTTVRKLAEQKNMTCAQISIAWLLHKGENIVPIPGTKQLKFLKENIAAAHFFLTSEEMQMLDDALSSEKIAGLRYNEQQMKLIDR